MSDKDKKAPAPHPLASHPEEARSGVSSKFHEGDLVKVVDEGHPDFGERAEVLSVSPAKEGVEVNRYDLTSPAESHVKGRHEFSADEGQLEAVVNKKTGSKKPQAPPPGSSASVR